MPHKSTACAILNYVKFIKKKNFFIEQTRELEELPVMGFNMQIYIKLQLDVY